MGDVLLLGVKPLQGVPLKVFPPLYIGHEFLGVKQGTVEVEEKRLELPIDDSFFFGHILIIDDLTAKIEI